MCNALETTALKSLPYSLQQKCAEVESQLSQGTHPQTLGAKKIRCLSNIYRIRISRSYRLLVGLEQEQWTSLELYSRQHFTTLINRRRRQA